MELTKKQAQGLDIAINRYLMGERFTTIAGFAGSGKSTLIKFIVDALGQYDVDPDDDIAFCAFTGKAAQVMIEKGNPNATTAHKLLYQSRPLPNGKFVHVPKAMLEYKVVVCDECSMLPKK